MFIVFLPKTGGRNGPFIGGLAVELGFEREARETVRMRLANSIPPKDRCRSMIGWVAGLLTAAHSMAIALAAEPHDSVRFDVPARLACRQATVESAAHDSTGKIALQVRLPITLFLNPASVSPLHEVMYRFELSSGLELVDYQPRTERGSEFSSPISVEQREEHGRHVTAGIGGALAWVASAKLEGGADAKSGRTLRYDLAPPTEATTASGTWGRGRGVYLKLRPSSQNTLEGEQDVSLTFLAPTSWRGGRLTIQCRAESIHKGMWRHERVMAGAADFIAALYLQGDQEAQQTAQNYATAEHRLRREAARAQGEGAKRGPTSLAYELGVKLELVEPRVALDVSQAWLQEIIFSHRIQMGSREDRLPPPLQEAAQQYMANKQALLALSATGQEP